MRASRGIARNAACGLLVLGTLLAAGCGRPPAPVIEPGGGPPGLARYFERQALTCRELRSYDARGRFTVVSGDFRVTAREAVYYQAPDRFRLDVEFDGLLWMGPTAGHVVVRGDSVYLTAPRLVRPWSGTRSEFLGDWSWRGILVLATLESLRPAGPLGCPSGPAGLDMRDAGDGRVILRRERDGLTWELLLGPGDGLAERATLAPRGEDPATVTRYGAREAETGLRLPLRVDLDYRSQDLLVTIEHEEQRRDPVLADSLFEPAGDGS